ncbi:MAG TPA: polysaccharide lyase family 8 super-sandwich domain-containing protein [Puia sp.]|nr:polysaccharide lyase family 8 super-sandwich domain-containing protein [Puia sp.]
MSFLSFSFRLRALLIGAGLLSGVWLQAQTVYDVVLGRIAGDLQGSVSDGRLNAGVDRDLKTLLAGGFWPDVQYSNPGFEHLARVRTFAMAFSRPGGHFFGDQQVYVAINSALQYWLDKDPRNRNWWFNDISYPQQLGQIMILMRTGPKTLPREMEDRVVQRMTRKLKPGDFANTSDEALHYLYRACLTRNKATMDSAVHFLFEPVAIRPDGQGLQVDNSYFQHGRQQAIASYGAVFVANSYNAAWYLRNTEYAMPGEQLKLLTRFFRDTYLQSMRGGFFDFNTKGRGVSRVNALGGDVQPLLQKAVMIDPGIADSRSSVNRHYWVGSYTLHTRPGYSVSVQLSSVRTLRTERGNNENILGKFLPDGATDIRRRGGEYYNIMPVWEWDKLPGVTNRDYGDDSGCIIRKEWGVPGTSEFAGGVSDSLYGAAAYILDYDSVQAHKSWFFFDSEMVCLGAGIRSKTAERITTTVNQCWQAGEVRAGGEDGVMRIKEGRSAAGRWAWVWHDSVGYFFPAGGASNGAVHIRVGKQSGSWFRINRSGSNAGVSGKVFTLWIDHGTAPLDSGYAYLVVPGIGSPAAMKAYNMASVRIVRNTADMQAVEQRQLDILQVVFYAPGTLIDGRVTVGVDRPCMVMIRDVHGSRPRIYVADPSQKLTSLEVSLRLPAYSDMRRVECMLPKTPYAGSTIKLSLEK